MSKPSHPVRKDVPAKVETVVAPNALDAAIVLKAINTMVSLKRERDSLCAECDRKDTAIAQLNNLIAEKDRAFATAIIERDAWKKTAETVDAKFRNTFALSEVADARRLIAEGRSRFWQCMFFGLVVVYVGIVVAHHFLAR